MPSYERSLLLSNVSVKLLLFSPPWLELSSGVNEFFDKSLISNQNSTGKLNLNKSK
jgi:hypothetical protein